MSGPRITVDEAATLRAFGAELAELRTDRGLTQAQLAHRAGLTQPSIAAYENGLQNPNFTTLIKLAHGLGMQPAHLVAAVPTGERP